MGLTGLLALVVLASACGHAAAATGSDIVDFSSVTWSWNNANSHLMPSDIPDSRVVADVGGGTAGQTNVWRRSNGTGMIRILSRSNLGGSTFRTAGLTKTLSHRRNVSGVGLYVAGVSAAEVKTIEAATGRSGRNEPVPGRIARAATRPSFGCVLNLTGTLNATWEATTHTATGTNLCRTSALSFAGNLKNLYRDGDASWIDNSLADETTSLGDGATHSVGITLRANLTGAERVGKVWFRNSLELDDLLQGTPINIVQAAHPTELAPSVTLALRGTAPPNGATEVVISGQGLTATATATDNDLPSVTYAWSAVPPVTFSGTGNVVTWDIPAGTEGNYEITVTATDSFGSTATASAAVKVIPPPICELEAAYRHQDSGKFHPDSVGVTKIPITFGSPTRDDLLLAWRRNANAANAEYCGPVPRLSASNFRSADWTPRGRGQEGPYRVGAPTESGSGWTYQIEFGYYLGSDVAQTSAVWMDTVGTGYTWPVAQRVPIRLRARVAPACGETTPAADSGKTRTYTVGGRYRMEGMTQNWTHLASGPDGGGCASTGFPLLAAGTQHICGYNGDARACEGSATFVADGANRTDPRTVSTEVTDAGVTKTLTAEWVAVRVGPPVEAGCTDPSLKVRNDGEDWIHLHFGCAHDPDGQSWYSGDRDYRQWGLTNAGLTWTALDPPTGQTDPTSITTPNPPESTSWPGSFALACPPTAARPISGFKVTGSATYSGNTKSDATGVSGICANPQTGSQLAPPSVTGVTVSPAPGGDGTWDAGETVEAVLTFDEAMTVDTTNGTPSVQFQLGTDSTHRSASYVSGTGTTALTFRHTVSAGQGPHTMALLVIDSLALNGGTIRSGNGTDANLAHSGAAYAGVITESTSTRSTNSGPTASFSAVPENHDGGTAFKVELRFSAEPNGLGYRTVRDALFDVTGGRIESVRRLTQGSNAGWELRVKPSGFGNVTLSARATTDCTAAHAVCDADGRRFDGTLEETIQGPPPTLSVADASVDEAEGATLEFAVTLSRTLDTAVTVAWKTADVTAEAGFDYTAANDTLTFAAGQTAKTISVAVLTDAHDEGSETLTVTLSDPAPTRVKLADGAATGTIRNTGAMPQAWIARFGRTVAEQVLDAVEGRLRAARTPGVEVSLAGERIGWRPEAGDGSRSPGSGSGAGGAGDGRANAEDRTARAAAAKNAAADEEAGREAKRLAEWLNGETDPEEEGRLRGRTVDNRELLLGLSFNVTAEAGGPGSGGGTVSVWGRGAVTGFDGRDGELTVDGEVASAMLGADWSPGSGSGAGRGRALAGLIVGHSTGEGGYRSPSGNGVVSSTLTGLYPWGRYALTGRVEVWGAAGYGEGALTLTPEGGDAIRTDLDLWMAAAGLRGTIVDGGADGFMLTAKTDAMAVETSTAAVPGDLAASEAGVTRLRLGLEGSLPVRLGDGAVLTPSMEIGARHDGGDAETGFGADIGGGIAWKDPKRGIAAEIRGRGLLTHEADGFRERGLSGTLGWNPSEGGRGPSLSLTQTFGGAASGGADALLRRGTMEGLAANHDGAGSDDLKARRLEARFGYGFAAFGGGFTFTPEAGAGLSDTGRDYSLGWRLVRVERGSVLPGASLELSFEATRRESAANDDIPPEHGVGLRLISRF